MAETEGEHGVNVKDWLHELIDIELRIKSKNEQVVKYRALAINSSLATQSSNGIENCVVSLCDAEADALKELAKLCAFRKVAITVIRAVPDQRRRDILEMRYVTGWPLSRIAQEMHYHIRWVQILHGKALNDVRAVLRGMPETVRIYSLDINS